WIMNHDILLSRLEHSVGLKGTALQWFKSYLSNRSFSVQLGPFSSTKVPLGYGVPQGSILGPILFSLYLLPLGSIFEKHHVSYHCYADDIPIYVPFKSGGVQMKLNFLRLNESKTELVQRHISPMTPWKGLFMQLPLFQDRPVSPPPSSAGPEFSCPTTNGDQRA
uniref:Reverse transcriptase domain-containing protein n=1 Tax=Oryzias sinensis TaxID=183150 RepID=A0A8C8DKC3_9TELE